MITKWTKEYKVEFRVWHEKRLLELYSNDTVLMEGLRHDREVWLRKV